MTKSNPLPEGAKRQTITFGADINADIEEYRKGFEKIPSYTQAVLELIVAGLKVKQK